jgi:hypothetical protein
MVIAMSHIGNDRGDGHRHHLVETEHKIFGHLVQHHAHSEIYKELHRLRDDDAKHGRNFLKDLHSINHLLQADLAKKHLPGLVINQKGESFDIKSTGDHGKHLRSGMQPQEAVHPHHHFHPRYGHLPKAVQHAIHGNIGRRFAKGEGQFVPPEKAYDDSDTGQPGKRVEAGQNSPSQTGFGEELLKKLGAPVTPENMRFLDAWQKAEGGSQDNPFNTTQNAEGARRFNSVGVKRYPSMEIGVDATVKTLTNGHYGEILDALQRGNSAHQAAVAVENSPWGTRDGVLNVLRKVFRTT